MRTVLRARKPDYRACLLSTYQQQRYCVVKHLEPTDTGLRVRFRQKAKAITSHIDSVTHCIFLVVNLDAERSPFGTWQLRTWTSLKNSKI